MRANYSPTKFLFLLLNSRTQILILPPLTHNPDPKAIQIQYGWRNKNLVGE